MKLVRVSRVQLMYVTLFYMSQYFDDSFKKPSVMVIVIPEPQDQDHMDII